MGAYRNPGSLDPLLAGTLGAVLTTWVTFVPCFLWIFLGAPYIESLCGNARLSAALSAITAAVVGVILNLAVWFGLHVVFASVREFHGPLGVRILQPELASLDLGASARSESRSASRPAEVAPEGCRLPLLPWLSGSNGRIERADGLDHASMPCAPVPSSLPGLGDDGAPARRLHSCASGGSRHW